MKYLSTLFFVLVFFAASAQTKPVEIVVEKDQFKSGENIHFVVKCAAEYELEIFVFTDGHLALHQQVNLSDNETPFDASTKDLPVGKYTVLVTGKGIHAQKEVRVI